MKIVLNGEPAEVKEGETLAGLIERVRIGGPVAAQVNDDIIHRDRLKDYKLCEGDRVELFRMMGGG